MTVVAASHADARAVAGCILDAYREYRDSLPSRVVLVGIALPCPQLLRAPAWRAYVFVERQLVRRAFRTGTVLVARDGTGIVGTVSISVADGVAKFARLAVRPSARGQGVGKALFRATVMEALSRGARELEWESSPWMVRAHGFYASLGMDAVEARSGALRYRLSLDGVQGV